MTDKRPRLTRISEVVLLRDRAYEAIKEAIVSLNFKPGQELRESVLSEELGISKTPIREALVQLQQEGLVKIIPFRGAFVSEINPRDVQEIFQVRQFVESNAAGVVAENHTEDDLKSLEDCLNRIKEALDKQDLKAYSEAGQAFHFKILEILGNHRALSIIKNLEDHLQRIRLSVLEAPGTMSLFFSQYQKVVDAIRARDKNAAQEAMSNHLRSVIDHFRQGQHVKEATEQAEAYELERPQKGSSSRLMP